MLDPRHWRLRSTLLLLGSALPAVFTAVSILVFSVDNPTWDEWVLGGYLAKFAQGTLSISDLFQQQNEYRQLFPNLIFVSLGWLTSWDVRSWMVVSFLLAGLISFCIYQLGHWSMRDTPQRLGWLYLIANLIIFSPVQYENWLQGQQLVYFLPIACFTASLLVAADDQLHIATRFGVCFLAAIICSFSSANGMLSWLLLLPVLAWSKSRNELRQKKCWIVAWTIGAILTAAIYFHGYQTPNTQSFSWTQINPLRAAVYFLATLGRPLAPGRLIPAGAVGLLLVVLFVWCCLKFWALRKTSTPTAKRMLPWLMLGAYSLLTAALITLGRSGHDQTWAVPAVRYTTYSIPLPVALTFLLPLALKNGSTQRARKVKFSAEGGLAFLAAAVVLIHLPIYLLGIRQMSSFRVASLQSKACARFANVLDDECLSARVYPNVATLRQHINAANRLGFIRPRLIESDRATDIEDVQARGHGNYGAFQGLTPPTNSRYVATGWAQLPHRQEPADVVLLAYEKNGSPAIIFAIVMLNTERDFVSALLGRGIYRDSRWSKSFALEGIDPGGVKLTAWGFDAYTGKAYKLHGEHVIQ